MARHLQDIQVRWSDEDQLRHVNNTRYLTYTEEARLRWLAEAPTERADGLGFILARTECDFVAPVHFATGGDLQVRSGVVSVGRTSVTVDQDVVLLDGSVAARTRSVLVAYDYNESKPRPWTDTEREWLDGWQ